MFKAENMVKPAPLERNGVVIIPQQPKRTILGVAEITKSKPHDEELLIHRVHRTYLLSTGRRSRNNSVDSNADEESKKVVLYAGIDLRLLLLMVRMLIVLLSTFLLVVLLDLEAIPTVIPPPKVSRSHNTTGCPIQFGSKLEPVPLLSFPGSGNTWLRNLLEEASGIYTGSVYDDSRLYNTGFTGEFDDPLSGRVLAVKAHLGNGIQAHQQWLPAEKMFQKSNLRCIYLLRHPVDTYFSTRAFQATHSHTGKSPYPDFHSMTERNAWRNRVMTWSDYYYETYTKLRNSCSAGIKVIFYEDLQKNPWKYTKKLVQWIENTPGSKVQVKKECIRMYGEGMQHRPHGPEEHAHDFPDDLFRQQDRLKLDFLIKRLNRTLDGMLPKDYSFYKR